MKLAGVVMRYGCLCSCVVVRTIGLFGYLVVKNIYALSISMSKSINVYSVLNKNRPAQST